MPDAPTLTDVPYGPHPRNLLDLWRAPGAGPQPVYLFVHGGGFYKGDKTDHCPLLREACLRAGIAFAAVNYRLTDTAIYPAPMLDGARAVQFLRHRAADWGLDPDRLALGGSSAGSGIAFWVAFRPDFAAPADADPVARQSTRVRCIASFNAQSSYDPLFIRSEISGPAWSIEALQRLFGMSPDRYETDEARKLFREVHMLDLVTPQTPPVHLFYRRTNAPMTPDLSSGHGIHHPRFGHLLRERMAPLGLECIVRSRDDFPAVPDGCIPQITADETAAFLRRHLRP